MNDIGTLQAADKKHVVIIGGGFAGIATARRLEKRLDAAWEIYLLSEENYLTFNPLLPEVVGASILPGNVVAPLRQMSKRTRFRMVRVTGVDPNSKTVYYEGRGRGRLHYDELVLACGQAANMDFIPGMAELGLPLKTVGDALFMRNRIVSRLEQATIEPDPSARDWLTTFIVVGGGFSGVEVAGELADFLYSSVRYYKNVLREGCRVIVLHNGDRLLPELPQSLGRAAYKNFANRAIDVRLNVLVTTADERGVTLSDGSRVDGGTIVCAVGTRAQRFADALDFPKERGRILTNPDLSVQGAEHIWAAGDCARVPNAFDDGICPPTAQFAERQGKRLADNLAAKVTGRPTQGFNYRPRGQLASIGHTRAVADVFGIKLSGFVAWLMWRALYLMKIPTLARKARLYLEWTWAMFFPPDIAHLSFTRTRDRRTKEGA